MINSGSIICGCREKAYICGQNDVLIFLQNGRHIGANYIEYIYASDTEI